MKHVCISLAAALALAVPSFAQVAQIGDTTYDTLAKAFAAVAEGGTKTTITVLADAEISETLTVPKGAKLTLNLDGHTLTAPETLTGPAITNYGSLTLQTNGNPSAIIAAGGPVIYNYAGTLAGATPATKGRNLTLKTTAQGDAAIAIVSEGGSVKLSGMTDSLIQGSAGAVGVRGGELSISSALTLDGGTGAAVALSPVNTDITFTTSSSGATFTSAGTAAVIIEGSAPSDGRAVTATVTSGTFTGTGADTVGLRVERNKGEAVNLTIDNGTVAFLKPIVAEGTDPVTGVVVNASFAADALPGETLLADTVAATYPALTIEGGITYDDFSGAVRNGSNGKLQEVTLIKDATGEAGGTLSQWRIVKVNLNGHSVAFAEGKGLTVDRASLTIEGEGSLNASGNVAVVTMKGSKTDVTEDCATLVVGKQVTLKGQAGVLVTPNGNAAYGVDVVVNGKIEAVDSGINVNGSINVTEGNVPTITLAETSAVTASATDSVGIYAGGYAIWNLKGDIRAADALSIKCGDITVSDGDYVAFGTLSVPPTSATSGSENTGSAVSITTNPDYAQKTNVTITGGTFTSTNGYAFYEGIAVKDGQPIAEASTAVIAIKGGDFTGSKTNEDVTADIAVTTASDKQIVSGGTFNTSLPEGLLAPDFVLVENKDGTYGVASAYVASIGDEKYADFDSFFTAFQAIAASETPTTVTLLADLTGDRTVPGVVPVLAGQNIVFDLNGHTMETALQKGSSTKHYYAIENSGTLTIKDSSTDQTGTIRARGVENLGNGKLTIESGTIVSVDANGGACIWNEADVTVKGGTFTTEVVGTPSDKFGPACLNNSGTALVTGGTFRNVNRRTYAIISNTGSIEITPAEGSEVKVFGAHGGLAVDGGTAVVNGGSYSSSEYYGLYVSNDGLGADPMQAAVTVNGGTFDGKSYSVWVGSDYNDPVNSTIAIKGGTFRKDLNRQSVSRHNALQVSGGTFAKPVDLSYCADGYIPEGNAETDTYGVTGGTYVAAIETAEGVAGYEALQAAFDAAKAGQTVTLIADVDCSDTGVEVGKSVTFDLNGRTLSLANANTRNLNIGAGATLTLMDSAEPEPDKDHPVTDGTGGGKIVATHDYAAGYGYGIINVSDGAAFVMESGLIDTVRENPVNKGQFGVMVAETGKATINGGHIRAGWYAIAGNGSDKTEPGTTIAVNGGILESTADYAIYHPQAGTLSIEGGTVVGAAGGLSINRGTATITGGTVTSQGTGDTGTWPDGTSGQGNAAITVGAEYGDVALAISGEAVITAPADDPAISVPDSANAQDIAISGGTFSEKPDNAWFAEGFIPVEKEDGTFGVIEGSFAAEINGVKYLTLEKAIAAVPENGTDATTITLLDDVTSADSLTFTNGQKAILNMNGKTVTFTSGKLQLQTATSLTLTGNGSLVCQTPSTGAISIYGNETSQIDLLVDSGVTVDGHYGIALFGDGAPACRNVTVTVKGTVKTSEGGTALYVNGTVNDLEGPVPQITLAEGAKVEAVSVGIYAAGYAKWTFAGDVTAGDDALSIKCGDITITGGTYMAKGEFNDPADANGNGTENTGAAVSITTNSAYAPKTNVTITGGTFISENGYAFYEGIAKKADGTLAAEASTAVIAIQGGTFVGNAKKGPIMIATAKDKQVITGGYFSMMPPNEFLADGVISIKDTAAPENAPVALRQFAAQCGTTAYPTLRDAIIHNQRSDKHGQTITLLRNVTETEVVQVGETLIANATDSNVIVDLNGKTVTFEDKGTFQITEKGALTLSGKGKVISKTADGDVVRIFGSQNDVANECVLNVGEDVILEGEVGIAVYKGYPVETKCLGVNVTVEGTIISHSSFAAYINGSNKTTTGNVPTFSFTGTSKIQADTVAVYAAGYGKWTFAGDVTASDDALSIKCGDITITGGTYMAKGEFNDSADANGNGTENTGAAVSITTNSAYAPKTYVTITGGTFISKNGYAFYEGIAKKADGTPAAEASTAVIAIQGGDFTGNADLGADIAITTASDKQVVSGGTFSKPVALAYCAPGYIPVVGTEGKYTVDGTAVAAVANPDAQGAYLGYGTLKALIDVTTDGTEVLIVNSEALGEEDANLLKTATGGDNATDGAKAYEVAETLGGTFKVKNGAIVYAYQLGIADLDVSESGISVTVRLEEDGTAVTRTLEGRKVRVVSDKTVLAEADAIFTDGACVLTVPAANLPAGNLELTISVAPAAEAETPAE